MRNQQGGARNLFLLPTRHAGNKLINECTKLINAWTINSPLHNIALKALTIIPSLLLQKPNKKSKAKRNITNALNAD